MKDIQIIDIDYSASNLKYKKEDEVDVAKLSSPWIVPEEGPIYGDDTLRVISGGRDLIRGTDWEPVETVTDLSELTGKPVYLYIELKDHILSSSSKLSLVYQRVGKPVISVKTLLQMLEDMVIQGKVVDWETQITGKPSTYYPAWHSHDIKNPNELIGFGPLVELFSMMTWAQEGNGTKITELLKQLQDQVYKELNYVQKLLWGAIMTHSRNYNNPHGIVPKDVDLGNVANYGTATPQQDSDALRGDLYSTPAGLRRVIDESAPNTEEFIIQSELPFGYYGSGIYLPPPITGSFEGLGGDREDSAFCQEGNGWTVGLIRAYDGRVKNLYYIYKTDLRERDANLSPWLHTYVQYQHPVITAAGKTANYVVNGSNNDIVMIGQVDDPANNSGPEDQMFMAVSNSTFDPNSHTMKPTNLSDFYTVGELRLCFGQSTVARVGDWIYLIISHATKGDDNLYPGFGAGVNNYTQSFYRAPYKDLTDKAKDKVTFARVNVTYDNLQRQRRTGPEMHMVRYTLNSENKVTQGQLNFVPPCDTSDSHRRRQFIVVPNPNNPNLARVRVLSVCYSTATTGGANSSLWADLSINYEWNVSTNTWTLFPEWEFATADVSKSMLVNPSDHWKAWCQSFGQHAQHERSFAWNAGSWIPGFGFVSLASAMGGTPPYVITCSIWNKDYDPLRDYEYMGTETNWWNNLGQHNSFTNQMVLRSPFGVSGFPRFYADLYRIDGKIRTTPFEIFYAEKEDQTQGCFYRITEGGDGDDYSERPTLQSKYIPKKIYGRKTNSSFGTVSGLSYSMGMSNRPKKKDVKSREMGLFTWIRRNVKDNPGVAPELSWKTADWGGQIVIPQETDGSIIINLNLNFTLDPVSKVLFAKPLTSEKLRIPRAIWYDLINNALEGHFASVLDYGVSFYICQDPGTNSDQPYCMFSIVYHLAGSPADTRSIIGLFNWDVASTGADGIKVMRMGAVSYPFTGEKIQQNKLAPPSQSPDNTISTHEHAITPNGTWSSIFQGSGTTVRYAHMEILDYPEEGARNIEQCWFTGIQIGTVGDAQTQRTFFSRRNNTVKMAKSAFWNAQAFNQYGWQVQANPQWGWLNGVNAVESGGAIDLMQPWYNDVLGLKPALDKYVMLGATYVEGNWSVFINADLGVTFNGYSMMAKLQNWDLRDLTDVYRNQTFYLYCVADGSSARYEISKILRNHSTASILIATIKTDSFGIVTIARRQSFIVSGFPLTRQRDMGVPVSSGAITELGTYQFLKRSELYNN